MPNYRRNYVQGGTYFFTVVTHRRLRIFENEKYRQLLGDVIRSVRLKLQFEMIAMVLLPDHMHCIWTLPQGDADYSTRWRQIKESFTRKYLKGGGEETEVSKSRTVHAERGVWQRRFWEHTCWDQDDMNRCIDYIHWNPVKHGLVTRVRDYPWSTFHKYVDSGVYDIDWGQIDPHPNYREPEWE
jgi:putative transposase